jgi:hypothetical protein
MAAPAVVAAAEAPLAPFAGCPLETVELSLPPPMPASGQSLSACRETSRTKATTAAAIKAEPEIAPARYV